MAGSRWGGAGGIAGLVDLIDQHGEAIDADLRHYYPGTRLADLFTGKLTFRELASMIRNLPGDGTALWRSHRRAMKDSPTPVKAVDPPADYWTPERMLLAGIDDNLRVLAWQNTADGHKGRNYPAPIPRPGVADPSKDAMKRGTPLSVAELRALLSDGLDDRGPHDDGRDDRQQPDHEAGDR